MGSKVRAGWRAFWEQACERSAGRLRPRGGGTALGLDPGRALRDCVRWLGTGPTASRSSATQAGPSASLRGALPRGPQDTRASPRRPATAATRKGPARVRGRRDGPQNAARPRGLAVAGHAGTRSSRRRESAPHLAGGGRPRGPMGAEARPPRPAPPDAVRGHGCRRCRVLELSVRRR